MTNRVYREAMQRSDCVHCLEAWFPNERDENKGRLGHMCELEEWDDLTVCQRGWCRYYRSARDGRKAEGGAE